MERLSAQWRRAGALNDSKLKHLSLCSPSGALLEPDRLDRAVLCLQTLGFEVTETPHCRARVERFAGTDAQRLSDMEYAAALPERSLIMASRGGYGASRLMNMANWPSIAEQLNRNGHILCGHSDITAIQMALMANGARPETLLHGPMASFDFGDEAGVNNSTLHHFQTALTGLVDVEWQGALYSGSVPQAALIGPVWGGNLTMLCALVGTPWLPKVTGGILVLEDVNEPVYKIERMILQLKQAGILDTQKAVILGQFTEPAPNAHDNGYTLTTMAEYIASQIQVPVLGQFPFGHCTPKCSWYQGKTGSLRLLSVAENGSAQWSLRQS